MQGAVELSVFYGVEILSYGATVSLRQQGSKTLVTCYFKADCGPVRCHGLHCLKTPNLVRLPYLNCDENERRNYCTDADQFCNVPPICLSQNRESLDVLKNFAAAASCSRRNYSPISASGCFRMLTGRPIQLASKDSGRQEAASGFQSPIPREATTCDLPNPRLTQSRDAK